MIFASDENGNRINIRDAERNKKYTCPCCGADLIQKRGRIVQHHFAHKALAECVSYYDNKGAWHRSMQELFPERNVEVFNNQYGRHIFDVLTDANRIIEFQNSPISYYEFQDRTDAYSSYAKASNAQRPIWVFNYTERYFFTYEKGHNRFRKIRWYRPTTIFAGYNKESSYELWFRIKPMRYRPDVDGKYITFHDERLTIGYLKVFGIYDEKYVYGDVYTEKEFFDYLKSL